MWRSRRWRKLLNLIDHLPRNSAFVEAQLNDEEAARLLLNQPDPPAESLERWSEWSPERLALARIEDRLAVLTDVLVQLNGGKRGSFHPAPRPRSALQRLRAEERVKQHRALVARLIPHRPPQGAEDA